MNTKSKITSPITDLRGVNAKIIKQLKTLNINTIYDLLFYLPKRYDDFSIITKIKDAKIGQICTISGTVMNIENKRSFRIYRHTTTAPFTGGMAITEATVNDGQRSIKAVWYNQPFLIKNINQGDQINIAGKIVYHGNLAMQNPAYEIIKSDNTTHTGRLVPVYRETKGLTSRWIRYLVKNALLYSNEIQDMLPEDLIKRKRLISIQDAIKQIHFPENGQEKTSAKRRLSFDELLLIQFAVLNSKKKIKSLGAPKIIPDIKFTKSILNELPFELTQAQKKTSWQIMRDMETGTPMNRLVEGDVGSGKTLVAIISAANVAKNRFQSAFMAPTEILASQHFGAFANILKNTGITFGLLTSSESKAYEPELGQIYSPKKTELLKMINDGKIDILIGTHSLIQESVKFKNLGLLILDEQHRFGVNQRAALIRRNNAEQMKNNASVPHLLSMTATPIPRTLAMALYGDLDISIINEMPKNRKKIITKAVIATKRKDAYNFIETEVKKGRQIFVICPKIEHKQYEEGTELSERQLKTRQLKAVKEEFEKLSKNIFPHLKVIMLHGKMKPKEKDQVMQDFKNKKFDILVSTSVVEVGVDVPNATIMMIEGADRFGLAQLHQFRGRVGRGEHQSYCFLFSDANSEDAQKRLKVMESSSDGFKLAEYDLQMRGPGDFFGSEQSGMPDLAMEALINPILISEAQEEAKKILNEDPTLQKHTAILNKLSQLKQQVHFE